MISNLLRLILNELAISYRNKTVYLMCFVPLFVVFVLKVVDKPTDKPIASKLGLIQNAPYPLGMVAAIESAEGLFTVSWLDSESLGKEALIDQKLNGFLKPGADGNTAATLIVLKKDALTTLAMLDGLAQLQRQLEAQKVTSWVSGLESLTDAKGMQGQTMTIWVLMLVLLVGFLVLPPQIAEEKEKKLILGLLQAPITEGQWLAAKIVSGMILALAPVALLHVATQTTVLHAAGYVIFVAAGTFCFGAVGIVLGLLCRSQGSARALGVVFYLPHLLPSALSDFSRTLHAFAAFVPSYHLFQPIKAMILEDAGLSQFLPQLFGLIAMGTLCCACASLILKRRWLV